MAEVSAFVLAGGKSTRMGRDKAQILCGHETLLSRALSLAREVAPQVSIVGSRERYGALAPVVEDVFPGQGPLGGIHAALRASSTDLNLILAVDTPLVEADFLRYLLRRAEESGAVVTVPRTHDGKSGEEHLHTLCGAYRREFADLAETALRCGHNRVDALFDGVRTLILTPEEIEHAGFSSAMFRNLNTPKDLEGL